MSSRDPWTRPRRIRAIAYIGESLSALSRSQKAAICASYEWATYQDEYAEEMCELSDSELEDLEHAVISLLGAKASASPAALGDSQVRHYSGLAERALEEIALDVDLDDGERARLVAMVGQVASTLRAVPRVGTSPVEAALTVIVGDLHIHSSTWEKSRAKKWYQIVASIVSGLLLALGAVGAYPGIKELSQDLGFGQPPAGRFVQIAPNRPTSSADCP